MRTYLWDVLMSEVVEVLSRPSLSTLGPIVARPRHILVKGTSARAETINSMKIMAATACPVQTWSMVREMSVNHLTEICTI